MKRAVYTRPDKPMRISVKRRDSYGKLEPIRINEPVIVDKLTECHVTPDDVASRMVAYLGPQGDYLTLEPSAGTGQLTKALLASGHSRYELTQVERHTRLASGLHQFGPVINRCFLEWAAEVTGRVEYPRIIMNPPFSEVRKHVAAALPLLGRGGHDLPAVLVALVPITFAHSDAETLEVLPADTFATAKVNTKIIRITKPN
ncbi:MAG: methyltransferase type 11 [Mesorhizobium sp.]|uniref:methyltransferase type 11 n=1 Tax=unclassified Mesorhizobium TaxID=325217 RepID=UPI000F762037|nr:MULTISPECIES: methyltransferase type 11 [unclassified Mesorhizobium]RVC81767.1 methyltransferase type 11 [Mesorhizobium sp. M2A.F.Ca.ET.046.02.1.1]AZO33558.1 methyltransferase type 11 [Mesorhizobium sp. M2A.F.Ca.ET.046.03.2.1]RWB42772.1 MAG: methyltransferase type 11 [Mesorhizobium sp.]RWC57900.1 MAG: methyltransferase type 11 [Mesorhizobium sp.]RWE22010.1 MAG: methyltransferase type 11 [Mesorhizobium sp.]